LAASYGARSILVCKLALGGAGVSNTAYPLLEPVHTISNCHYPFGFALLQLSYTII
jgi:hypothetical protein